MDHTITLDNMMIFSNFIPAHINHPSFGVYLITALINYIFYLCGLIDGLNISDLINSISPLVLIHQWAEINRSVVFIIIPSISLLIALGIRNFLQSSKPYHVLFLFTVFASGYGLIYHSSMLRSELFSIFYFSIAFYLITLSILVRNYATYFPLFFVAGIFLGLMLFTKIQSIFYFIFALIFIYRTNRFKQFEPSVFQIFHSCFNLLLFFFIAFLSYNEEIPAAFATFTEPENFKFNIFFYFFSLLYIIGFSYSFFSFKTKRSFMGINLDWLNFLLSGFIFSLFFHFLLPLDLRNSSLYLLYNFKIVFIRITYTDQSISDLIPNLLTGKNQYLKEYFLELCALFLISLKMLYPVKKEKILYFINVLIIFILTLNIALGVRFITRDFIWVEIFIVLLIFLFLADIQKAAIRSFLICSVSAILIISNISKNQILIPSIVSQYNLYGFDFNKMFASVYSDRIGYNAIMGEKYPSLSNRALLKDIYWTGRYNKVKSIFPGFYQLGRNLNIAFIDSFVSLENEKIIKLSENLIGATLVNVGSESISNSIKFKGAMLRSHFDSPNNFEYIKNDSIQVIYRQDSKIYLLSENELNTNTFDGKILKTKLIFNTESNFKKKLYFCYEVVEFLTIENLKRNSYLFLVL